MQNPLAKTFDKITNPSKIFAITIYMSDNVNMKIFWLLASTLFCFSRSEPSDNKNDVIIKGGREEASGSSRVAMSLGRAPERQLQTGYSTWRDHVSRIYSSFMP